MWQERKRRAGGPRGREAGVQEVAEGMEERPRGASGKPRGCRPGEWQQAEYTVMGSVERSYSEQMPAPYINSHVQVGLMSLRGVPYDSRPPGATEQVLLLRGVWVLPAPPLPLSRQD